MENLLIIALALCATLTPFWLGQRYGTVAYVSPMHLLGYFCAAGFLVKVLVFSAVPEWAFYSRFIDTNGAALIGAIYLTGFVMMLCLGYRLAVGKGDRPVAVQSTRFMANQTIRRGWVFAAAFAIAALTLVLILRARGASGLSFALLETLNSDKQINVDANGNGMTLAGIKSLFIVPKCAFVLLFAHWVVTRSAVSLLQTLLVALLLIVIALVSGDRFELVELFAYGCITYLIVGGKARLGAVLLAMTAAALVLWMSAYMTTLRGSEAGLLHQIVGSTYFLDINTAVMVTDRVTTQMQLWGESYLWWAFGWFPRALWPDKSAIDLGVFLKLEVMGLRTGGGFNVTGPGEAYINFGPLGVFVGLALGWVYRRVEVALLAARNVLGFGSHLLYPLLFYPFVQASLQSSFSSFVVGAVAQLALIAGVLVFCLPR
ncbi:MAG: oligosaccharide repeat unit polymerase [Yoonia sp.]|uniref:oligosaccharide repeat unit polymerase n=1 Tax=Yoonia sp. TaxID=2212373 RepID=UPI003EF403A4